MSATHMVSTDEVDLVKGAAARPRSWRHSRWMQGRRFVAGLLLIVVTIVVAIVAPWLTPHMPNRGDYSQILQSPSTTHLMGTDGFGRDIFTRVVFGLRISLIVAFGSVVPAILVGVPLGLLAGYNGSRIDAIIMRPIDLLISFPPILLAVTLVAMFGTRTSVTIMALTFIWIPIMARVLRGSVMTVRGEEFVEAAVSMGGGSAYVAVRHVLPNCLGPLIVQASISLGISILIEAALSFVGLGTQPPNPSLGGMLAENKDFMRESPWSVVVPGGTIMIIVLGFNLLGDGIRDLLASRRR